MNNDIVAAVLGRHMIEFDYGGHHRVGEVHLYGCRHGVDGVLVYQIGGTSSSGGLPQWRRFDVHGMSHLVVCADCFPGPRPAPSGVHSIWDRTYAIVTAP